MMGNDAGSSFTCHVTKGVAMRECGERKKRHSTTHEAKEVRLTGSNHDNLSYKCQSADAHALLAYVLLNVQRLLMQPREN